MPQLSNSGVVRIKMPTPHPGQQKVLDSPARFKVLVAGRRWGKTQVGSEALGTAALQLPGMYWWVGLSWRSASMKRAWRLLRGMFRGIGRVRLADKEIHLRNGSEIWLRTAERPDSLTGEGLRGAVMDEYTLMEERVWTEYVRPGLADYRGWALFEGVPKGFTWAHNLWMRGANREDDWESFTGKTEENPIIARSELAQMQRDLPELVWRQECLAEWVSDAGQVFRRVMEAARAELQLGPVEGHEYILGVDWGRSKDYTVIAVIDVNEQALVYFDRFNKLGYALQTGRLKAMCELWHPVNIIAERNAMGDPLVESLQGEGLPVEGFTTTSATKAEIIEGLSLAFEKGEIRIISEPVLIGELQSYELQRTASGLSRYGAPRGLHDDCVMALAMAWHSAGVGAQIAEWGVFV